MKIEIIRSEEQWRALAEEWNRLLEQSVSDVPFLRHEYLLAWWQHRGGGEWQADELYILLGRGAQGDLLGAIPFFISKNHAGNPTLRLVGSIEISDFLDALARPADLGAFLQAALSHLTGPDAPVWDTLEWENLLESSPTLSALEAAAKAYGLAHQVERLQPSPSITLPADFDIYLDSLDTRYRRELMRKARNALGYFIPVQVVRIGAEDDLHAAMEDFFTMMREETEKQAFLTEAMVAQMHAIVQAAADNGWLDLRFLLVGREKAAGYFNFIYRNRVWVYNSCLAQKFSNLSPGIVLMSLLIQDAIEQGMQDFDLMRGDEEYKYQLGGVDRWVVKVTLSK